MRIFGLLVALVLALQAPPPPAQAGTGVIRGRVVRAGDSGPIDDAQVFLNRGPTPATAAGARGAGPGAGGPRVTTATSDREGSFEFRELAPGRYTVSVQRTGYSGLFMNSPDPSVSVMVSNGQTTDAVVTMTPTGVIRGRVRDAAGAFLSNIPVDAIEIAFRNSLPYLMPVVSKTTDDRGEYRLYGLPPGDYYIAATPRPLSAIAARAGGTAARKRSIPALWMSPEPHASRYTVVRRLRTSISGFRRRRPTRFPELSVQPLRRLVRGPMHRGRLP